MPKRPFPRATNRQGKPVRGIYTRDGRLYAGFSVKGHWFMKQLRADTVDDAIIERERIIRRVGGRLPRKPPPPDPKRKDIDMIYSDARKLAQQVSLSRPLSGPRARPFLAEAEGLIGRGADLIFEAWRAQGV